MKLLSTNTINKIYAVEINDFKITDIILNITKNDYYEVYDFNNNFPDIPIPININQYKPHLVFKNLINSKFSSLHKIFSSDNNFDIYLDDSKLLNLDSNGNLNLSGSIDVNNIYLSGDIYTKFNNIPVSITSNLNYFTDSNFYIHKENISFNSSNIFLNPSIINNGGIIINGSDIHNKNNLFEINNYINNDNFITLNSVSSSGFINFKNIDNIYKIGINNGNFGIWKSTNYSILNNNFIENNLNNFSNLINFNFNNNNLNIDINGDIKTSSNFSINNITTYIDDNIDYKLRIYGNLKVDGVVMSSSDKRVKKDINIINNALDKIEKLSGVFYYNINDTSNIHKHMGLIAQDVKEVIPEVVYEDDKGFLNIAYGNIMGLIIEGIKELRNEIKNIK